MSVAHRVLVLALVGTLVVTGCTGVAPTPAAPQAASPGSGAAPAPAQRKAITIALTAEISSLVTELGVVGRQALPTRYAHEFLNSYMTTRNHDDEVVPWMAERLPSLDDGTWRLLDDGRMEVTWQIRRGVKWHDGREVTSADLKFAWEAEADPNTIIFPRSVARQIDRVDTPDPYTAVLHWKGASQLGGELGERQMDVLPRHVLEDAFRADATTFSNHPYFSSPEAFVGSGPYRPIDWQRGSHLALEAFDGYFLGRAKIDRVTLRFIEDPQTALANVLAGAVDMSYHAVPLDEARIVQREWQAADKGTVLLQPNNFRHLMAQLRPEHASPSDILDVSVRRALAHAINREEVVDVVGVDPSLIADAITFPGTPIGDAVARAVVRYPFDLTRASALLADAGWRRGADGLLAKGGQRFRLEYQTTGSGDQADVFPLLQQQYRRVGIDLHYAQVTGADLESGATWSGIAFRGLPSASLNFTTRWHSRFIAAPANRFSGNNLSGYSNPATDRAIEQLNLSVRLEDQVRWWAESWRLITEDAAAIGLYHYPNPYIVRKGITGPLPRMALGSAAFQVHTWDVQ